MAPSGPEVRPRREPALAADAAKAAPGRRRAAAMHPSCFPRQPQGERRVRGAGLYPHASLLNHDCLPNVVRFDRFDAPAAGPPGSNAAMEFRSLHDLPPGERVRAHARARAWCWEGTQEEGGCAPAQLAGGGEGAPAHAPPPLPASTLLCPRGGADAELLPPGMELPRPPGALRRAVRLRVLLRAMQGAALRAAASLAQTAATWLLRSLAGRCLCLRAPLARSFSCSCHAGGGDLASQQRRRGQHGGR